MGTRALIGYLDTDGGAKLTSTYNHYDGYPSNLGKGLENFYDNDAKAEEIANVGYISYLDPETGEWEAANKQKPEMTTLPDNFNKAMMEIAAEVDSFGADYGYIWDNENEEWITVKNNGIGAMTDNLEMELAHLKGEVKITTGLAFMGHVIIDSHFDKRGRFNRLAQAVASNPQCTGIGLGEDTGVIVTGGNNLEVVGSGAVVIVDGRDIRHTNITEVGMGEPIALDNLRVSIMVRGNRYLLKERKFIANETATA